MASMIVEALPETPAKRLWTYDEMVAELPETNQPIELWDGELVMSPTPTPNHQRIVLRLTEELNAFVRRDRLGEVFISPLDVILSPHRVIQPDVFFISNANKTIVRDRVRGVPDLAVEVISPGTWRRDRVEKKALYEQVGVAEYWIIDSEARTIEVFALTKGSYQLHSRAEGAELAQSKLLEGFSVAFSQLEV